MTCVPFTRKSAHRHKHVAGRMTLILSALFLALAVAPDTAAQTLDPGGVMAFKCKCRPILKSVDQIKIGMKWKWKF